MTAPASAVAYQLLEAGHDTMQYTKGIGRWLLTAAAAAAFGVAATAAHADTSLLNV